MFVLSSLNRSGVFLQRLLSVALQTSLLCTGIGLLNLRNTTGIFHKVIGLIDFALLTITLLFDEKIITYNQLKLYASMIHFGALIYLAIIAKDRYLVCALIIGLFWIPMAIYNAVILHIPSISKILITNPLLIDSGTVTEKNGTSRTNGSVSHASSSVSNTTSKEKTMSFYLGNAIAVCADESSLLRKYKITHVLELTDDQTTNDPRKLPSDIILSQHLVGHHVLNIGDNSTMDIFKVTNQALEFIRGCHSNSGVLLIHCSTGISLSPLFAVLYLVKECNVPSVWEAYKIIREARPLVYIPTTHLKALQNGLDKKK